MRSIAAESLDSVSNDPSAIIFLIFAMRSARTSGKARKCARCLACSSEWSSNFEASGRTFEHSSTFIVGITEVIVSVALVMVLFFVIRIDSDIDKTPATVASDPSSASA